MWVTRQAMARAHGRAVPAFQQPKRKSSNKSGDAKPAAEAEATPEPTTEATPAEPKPATNAGE
jgi:hypothetical protein